ncbi:MAG: hypothetical protein P1U56_15925 [Saprospiraceae bacterium]|nr:hypothetical protein [Saprospiraceae bacterium]
MKTIYTFSLLICSLLLATSSFAQHYIGPYSTIKYSNLAPNYEINTFNPKSITGFGITYQNRNITRFNYMVQLSLEHVSWTNQDFETWNSDADLNWRRSSINLAIGLDYTIKNHPDFRFGIIVLPKIGYVYDLDFQTDDAGINLSLFYIPKTNSFMTGLETKMNLQFTITEFISLDFRPGVSMVTYFEDKEFFKGYVAMDIGLTYSI